MPRRSLFVLVAALLCSTMGCAIRVADLTVASTRGANLDSVDLDALPTKRHVVGEDLKWWIVLIPIGWPDIQSAIDDALDKGGGDVMTDVTIERVSWWFLVGQEGYRVTGDVVDTRRGNSVNSVKSGGAVR